VHKKVQELQHGKDPADMGGVNIDGGAKLFFIMPMAADRVAEPNRPGFKRFLQYYVEELKEQFRGNTKK
jgi:hypothetical protein